MFTKYAFGFVWVLSVPLKYGMENETDKKNRGLLAPSNKT
jgi:hypothetical protein